MKKCLSHLTINFLATSDSDYVGTINCCRLCHVSWFNLSFISVTDPVSIPTLLPVIDHNPRSTLVGIDHRIAVTALPVGIDSWELLLSTAASLSPISHPLAWRCRLLVPTADTWCLRCLPRDAWCLPWDVWCLPRDVWCLRHKCHGA